MTNLERIAEMQMEGRLGDVTQEDADILVEIANKADQHDSELPFILVLVFGMALGVMLAVGATFL